MKCAIELASCGMIYLPRFMKISIDVQPILKFFLRNLKACNVGITDGRDLRSEPLRWTQWHDIHTEFHEDWFRHLSNIAVITTTI
jgi:hypothetical protein